MHNMMEISNQLLTDSNEETLHTLRGMTAVNTHTCKLVLDQ